MYIFCFSGGICFGIFLFIIECISKYCTNLDIPLLDVYDRRDNVDLDQFDPNNWNNILMRKNEIIHQKDAQINLLKKKNYKLTQLMASQGSGKPWYKKFTTFEEDVSVSDVKDVSDIVIGNGLEKREIGNRIISDL